MRPLFSLLLLVLTASLAYAQPDLPREPDPNDQLLAPPVFVPKTRTGTPQIQIKEDINAFANNLNQGNGFMENFRYISGANVGFYGANEWAKNWANYRMRVIVKNITIDKIEGDTATVTLVSQLTTPLFLNNDALKERFAQDCTETLTLVKGKLWGSQSWQFLTPAEPVDPNDPQGFRLFAYTLSVLAQKVPTPPVEAIFGGLKEDQSTRSLNNLKQLGLGVMQFVQDYDEIYAFLPQYTQEALMPYLKSQAVFLIPGTRTPYTFNGNLSRTSLANLAEPARTILFYEGENEKPLFHYDGKAAIAYTDGHCVLASPEEIKASRWKP